MPEPIYNPQVELEIAASQLAGVPHLEEWLGPWAMQEEALLIRSQWLASLDLVQHLRLQQSAAQERAEEQRMYPVTKDGIALIEMRGPLMKHVPSMASGTSTVLARRKLRAARQDSEVAAVLMIWETPGGTVRGNYELASEIADTDKIKPVWGQVEDLCASAGIYAASACAKLFSNAPAMIGAIGTYGVVIDSSERAKEMKIKVHVVKAGQFKGMGTPGTEITAEMLAVLQEEINDHNDQFLRAVATGRRLSIERVRELADGRAYIAAKAKELGLVDGVQSLDATLAQLASVSAKPRKGKAMESVALAAAELKPAAATIGEIESCCKGADAAFVLAQAKQGATKEQALQAWVQEQQARLEKSEQARADAEAKLKPTGHKPLATKGKDADDREEEATDPVEQFNAKVAALMAKGIARTEAVVTVANKHRELHAAYLLATNPGSRAQRLIKEKFE